MAYDASKDYSALNEALKKKKAATANTAEQAKIQSEIDANQQSRVEKIASNLSQYGKWANDSELDSAAGIMATNQIGTGYEAQKANLNKSYDNAKQNANNDALSRGMARSSYVSDRLSSLDSERANALSDVDAAKALAIQNAKQSILNDYTTNRENALENEKKEFSNTINAYYNDFQQEINNVRNNNDSSDDWKIPYLQAARNEKMMDLYGTTDENAIAAQKTAKTINDGTYTPKGPDPTTDVVTQIAALAETNAPSYLYQIIQQDLSSGEIDEATAAKAKQAIIAVNARKRRG